MNRKILALILALVAVAAAIVLAVTMNPGTPAGEPTGTGATDTAPSLSGLEDSIFDDEPVETQEPTETTVPDETENAAAVPEVDIPVPEGSAPPESGRQDSNSNEPEPTQPPQTEPVATEPAETEPVQIPEGEIDYEAFVAMDPALQRMYMESFESMDAFFAWYNAAKEAYEQAHPSIDVGDGVIDLEDLVGRGQ